MNYYDEDVLLEKKEEDDEDDGLLSHGIKKEKKKSKKDQLYDDWNNKRIMSGKAKGSRALYDKEEGTKNTIRRVAKGAALIGGVVAAHNIHQRSKDPVAYTQRKAQHQQEKNQAALIRGQARADAAEVRARNKTAARLSKKEGIRGAKFDARTDAIYRKQNRHNDRQAAYDNTGRKPGFFARHVQGYNENYIQYLFENFTEEEISRYLILSESKEDKAVYKEYCNRMKQIDSKPLSYKEWKDKKYEKKKKLRRIIAAGALAGVGANEYRHYKKGDPDLKNRIRNRKMDNFARKSTFKNDQNNKILQNNSDYRRTNLREELIGISKEQLAAYLEMIDNEDFMKNSYNRYCVMAESKGLTPLDEGAFEEAKKRISAYSKAAIDGIKAEKEKKEAELKKKEEEKKKKEAEKAKAEKEKISKMSIEEKKEYLRKKKKKEEEEEEKRQDAHDLKQTFKQSFIRGSGEQLGKSAARMATRFISK